MAGLEADVEDGAVVIGFAVIVVIEAGPEAPVNALNLLSFSSRSFLISAFIRRSLSDIAAVRETKTGARAYASVAGGAWTGPFFAVYWFIMEEGAR